MTSATLPHSLISISDYVFAGCDALSSLTVPESCTSIGEGVFDNCPNLTLTVAKGSYAEQYAQENGIPYVYGAE